MEGRSAFSLFRFAAGVISATPLRRRLAGSRHAAGTLQPKSNTFRLLATKAKRVASVDSDAASSARYQAEKIRNEVLSRFKQQNGLGAAKDVAQDDPDAFWPTRDVNLGKEFPNLFKPLESDILAAGRVKVVDQATLEKSRRPQDDSSRPEDDEGHVDEDKVSAPLDKEDGESVAPAPPKRAISADERERRRLSQLASRMEELPHWAKKPIAVNFMKFEKTLSEKDLIGESDQFESLGIQKSLVDAIAVEWNITRPTEIQKLAIPEFSKGSNILCAAQTGTGKTLSYLLPLFEKLHQQASQKGYLRRGQRTRALIVIPNRELGLQVLEVIKTIQERDKSGRFAAYKTLLLSGGADSFKHETQNLTPGLDILLSTPERLVNHLETHHLHLDDLRTVIFDEADTLMSRPDSTEKTLQFISFIKESIAKKVTLNRVQHVFVSATVSKPLLDLLKKEYKDTVSVVSSAIHKSVPQLKQDFLYGAGGDFRFRSFSLV